MGDITDVVKSVKPSALLQNKAMVYGGIAALTIVGILYFRRGSKEVVTVGNPQAPSEAAAAMAQEFTLENQRINSSQAIALASLDNDRYMADIAAKLQAENNDAYLSGLELQTTSALASQVANQEYNVRMAYDQLVWGQKALETQIGADITKTDRQNEQARYLQNAADNMEWARIQSNERLASYSIGVQHDLGKKQIGVQKVGLFTGLVSDVAGMLLPKK